MSQEPDPNGDRALFFKKMGVFTNLNSTFCCVIIDATNKGSNDTMNKRSFNPTGDAGSPTVYVGAYISHRLYRLLTTEAVQANLSRSRMIGRVLAERYGREQEDGGSEQHAEQEAG